MSNSTGGSKFSAWFGRNLLLAFGLFAIVVSGGLYFLQSPTQTAELERQEQEIAGLEAAQSNFILPNEEDVINDVLADVSGMSLERQERDTEVAREVMRQATTWKAGQGYVEARDALKEKYNFTEDSEFLTVFMPGPDQGAYRVASSGETYFAYPDANSTMKKFESTLVEAGEDQWRYFALTTIQSSSPNGGKATNVFPVSFSVTSDGELAQIRPYISKFKVLHANG